MSYPSKDTELVEKGEECVNLAYDRYQTGDLVVTWMNIRVP